MAWRYIILGILFSIHSIHSTLLDDRIPCSRNTGLPIYATCVNLNELWVPIIEKAMAKLHGCYESLNSGFIDDALCDLTGFVAEKFNLHNSQNEFPNPSLGNPEMFWYRLKQYCESKCLMGCSISGGVEHYVKDEDGYPTGLLSGHAYGIMDVFELPRTDHPKGKKFSRLVRIRNPHGKTEWTGRWGDDSDEVEDLKKELDGYIQSLPEEERYTPGENDGTFLMNFKDWR